MWMFYLLILVPIALQHIEIKGVQYEKKNRFALTLFFAMLTALVMLRHESVGNDTRNYIYYFRRFASLEWKALFGESVEFGFTFYNKIVSIFSNSPQFFFVMTAIITMAMIYPTYRRLCTDASLTISLFCVMSTFVMMFSGIRQMLAISIGVLAYELASRKKLVWFVIVVLVAMTFHISAFMLFALYPLYHCKITKKTFYAAIPILVAVFLFNKQIFNFLLQALAAFTRFETVASDTGAYSMLILFVLLTIFSYWIPDESKLDDETKGLRNIMLFAVVIQMFAPLHTLAMRMNYYYIIFIPLLIPKVIAARKDSLRQVALTGRWVMVIFFTAYFFLNASTGGSLRVFPYHFFWESGV